MKKITPGLASTLATSLMASTHFDPTLSKEELRTYAKSAHALAPPQTPEEAVRRAAPKGAFILRSPKRFR